MKAEVITYFITLVNRSFEQFYNRRSVNKRAQQNTEYIEHTSVETAFAVIVHAIKVFFNVRIEDNPNESQLFIYAVCNTKIRIKSEVSRGAIATPYDMSGRISGLKLWKKVT